MAGRSIISVPLLYLVKLKPLSSCWWKNFRHSDHCDKGYMHMTEEKKTRKVTLDMLDESVTAHIRDLIRAEIAKIREEERQSRGWKPFELPAQTGPKEHK